jgi:hypothetical protein
MVVIYLLRVIYENEESIYDFDSGIYEYKISRVCLSLNLQDYPCSAGVHETKIYITDGE